jgi:hypothetical protein
MQLPEANVDATALAGSVELWVKTIGTVTSAGAAIVAFLYNRQVWPFRPRIPQVIRREWKRVASSHVFVRTNTIYHVTFLRLDAEYVWVRIEFKQSTMNVTRKDQTLVAKFSTNNRKYVLKDLRVDRLPVEPLKTSSSEFEVPCAIPSRKTVEVSAIWEIAYRTTDSELMVSYGLGESLEIEIRDDVSAVAGRAVFAFDIEPLVEYSKLEANGITQVDGHKFSRKLVLKNGHLPNTGANIRWQILTP